MKATFGERVIDFNRHLRYDEALPEGFAVLNPYVDNPETMQVMRAFYERFYSDNVPRRFIIGINRVGTGRALRGYLLRIRSALRVPVAL